MIGGYNLIEPIPGSDLVISSATADNKSSFQVLDSSKSFYKVCAFPNSAGGKFLLQNFHFDNDDIKDCMILQ